MYENSGTPSKQTNCSYINPERKQINRGLEGSLQKYDVVKSLKVDYRPKKNNKNYPRTYTLT